MPCARDILDNCHTTKEAYVGGQLDAHEYLCDSIDGNARVQRGVMGHG